MTEYENDFRINERYLNSGENKTPKKFSSVRDSNPWTLRNRYSALPTGMSYGSDE